MRTSSEIKIDCFAGRGDLHELWVRFVGLDFRAENTDVFPYCFKVAQPALHDTVDHILLDEGQFTVLFRRFPLRRKAVDDKEHERGLISSIALPLKGFHFKNVNAARVRNGHDDSE